jgi:ferredoxin-NADP reductase
VPDFSERLFYVSGPEPMVQGISRLLVKMGLSRRRIRRDFFPGYSETH